jgi:hypothetical protein
MSIEIDAGDIIAGFALILSAYATWQTVTFNKKQKSLVESQEKLNNLLLEKEKSESDSAKQAELGANFIKVGPNKTRLKVWNKGPALAREVMVEFPEGNDIVIASELTEKLPMEVLEKHQAVEFIAAPHMQSRRKYTLKLIWRDERPEINEKVVYLTL